MISQKVPEKKWHMAIFLTIALCIVTSILAFAHFIFYEFLLIGFGIVDPWTLHVIKIMSVILTVSFVIASIITRWGNNPFTRAFYFASATWLGFLLYFFIVSLLYIVYLSIGPVSRLLAEVLLASAFLVGVYGFINANKLRVTKISVELANLPMEWKGRKAIFMSDIHLGQVRGRRFFQKVVDQIKKLQPSLVFIGGDVYDGVKVDVADVVAPLREIHPSLGMYFVPGNHEEFSESEEYLNALGDAGVKVLEDNVMTIDGVRIVGVDYKTTEDLDSYKKVLERLVSSSGVALNMKDSPTILLKHVPSHIEIAEQNGISLQLSGHTHRAQLFPFSFITYFIYKGFDYGLKRMGNTQVYTSSGVGTWGPPFRVGTRSEIVLVEFK